MPVVDLIMSYCFKKNKKKSKEMKEEALNEFGIPPVVRMGTQSKGVNHQPKPRPLLQGRGGGT